MAFKLRQFYFNRSSLKYESAGYTASGFGILEDWKRSILGKAGSSYAVFNSLLSFCV